MNIFVLFFLFFHFSSSLFEYVFHLIFGSVCLRAGPHSSRFGTSVSSPEGKYEAFSNASRWEACWESSTENKARSPAKNLPTRLNSSRERRNARPAVLILRTYSYSTVVLTLFWRYNTSLRLHVAKLLFIKSCIHSWKNSLWPQL